MTRGQKAFLFFVIVPLAAFLAGAWWQSGNNVTTSTIIRSDGTAVTQACSTWADCTQQVQYSNPEVMLALWVMLGAAVLLAVFAMMRGVNE